VTPTSMCGAMAIPLGTARKSYDATGSAWAAEFVVAPSLALAPVDRVPGPSLSAASITQPEPVAGSSQPQQPLRNVHGIRALGPALSIELSRKRKCIACLTLDPCLTLHVLG